MQDALDKLVCKYTDLKKENAKLKRDLADCEAELASYKEEKSGPMDWGDLD